MTLITIHLVMKTILLNYFNKFLSLSLIFIKLNVFDCNLFIKDKFINDHYECNITDFDNNVIKDNPDNRNYPCFHL